MPPDAPPAPLDTSPDASPLERPPPAAPPAPAIVVDRTPPPRMRDLLAMVAIVALCDVAFYQGAAGAGRALLIAGIPAILFATAPARAGSPRLAAIAGLLALVAARCLWQSSAGATALGIAMVLAFAIALRTPRSFVPELVASGLASVRRSGRQLWSFIVALARLARPGSSSRARWTVYAVPAGLVALFAAIFAAANPVIADWLRTAVEAVDDAVPSPVRIAFWALCAVAAAGLLRPVLRTIARIDARLGVADVAEPTGAPAAAPRIALARNSMIALNALFLGYNALDAEYLWRGHTPSGMIHTQYAHAGAVWLTIAFVLSTIVLGALFRGPIEHDARGRLARALAYVWAGQNFILAAGTFRRITMYIAYSGLTELRIVGVLGTSLATLGLAIVVYKVARHRTMLWVMRRQLDALAIAVVLFVAAPTGDLAMRYNVARIAVDQYRPLLHLFEQPIRAEAVPALLPLLDHPDPVVREGVAAMVVGKREQLRADDARAASWLDYEIARDRALSALDGAAGRIARVAPRDGTAAWVRLYRVARGVNDEVERAGDDAPYDWRAPHHDPPID